MLPNVRATIAVLTSPGHPNLLQSRYAIREIADHWGPLGVRFEVTANPAAAPAGDLGWQHLDATKVPMRYQRALARYPVTINGGLVDISKRHVASHLVARGDSWDGPVMVKTDSNFGGHADDWTKRWMPLRHPRFHAVRDRLPPWLTGHMRPEEYRIYTTQAQVPAWVWRDRRFVVQRFLAAREGPGYVIWRYFCLGPRTYTYRAVGGAAVVSGDGHAEWERIEQPPAALAALRSRIHLDFGKVDFGVVDGEAVIYDVNPAVSADGPVGHPLQRAIVAELIPGLEWFLERAGR